MNNIIISGRLTRNPDIRASQDGNTLIARYTLAVDRMKADSGADFINCTAFNKTAEFAEKYLNKGMKIIVQGSLHIDSYTNKGGVKMPTHEIYVERTEFCEGKKENNDSANGGAGKNGITNSGTGKYANRA